MDAETIQILTSLQKQLAIMEERERALKEDISELKAELQTLRNEITDMKEMANRWKGGFIVLAGIGGIVGWILSSWQTIVQVFTAKG